MSYSPQGRRLEVDLLKEIEVKWTSPSNIALVKYWGKYGDQLPQNASISFTLDTARSETKIKATPKKSAGIELRLLFDSKREESFEKKITKFLSRTKQYWPWTEQYFFEIESVNSFPHSSGIASSASGMSALVMCLLDIESQLSGEQLSLKKASFLSRLASGSASRSVYPKLCHWGEHPNVSGSNNLYAIPIENVDPIFETFRNDILIVSAEEKPVSSSAGHQLMETNVFASQRFIQANNHLESLIQAMQRGDLNEFGRIVELEAMVLHALMMSSEESYILIKPATLQIIERIRSFRKRTKHPVFFTLDAGPNIHMLYPGYIAREINEFINDELINLCHQQRIIKDKIGLGPQKISI